MTRADPRRRRADARRVLEPGRRWPRGVAACVFCGVERMDAPYAIKGVCWDCYTVDPALVMSLPNLPNGSTRRGIQWVCYHVGASGAADLLGATTDDIREWHAANAVPDAYREALRQAQDAVYTTIAQSARARRAEGIDDADLGEDDDTE